MKVLHVETGRHLYGGARQVAYLLNGLSRYPGQHALVCSDVGEMARAIENGAVTLYPVPMRGDLDLAFIGRLRRIIRRERPDLLHIHSRRGDMVSALAGYLEGVPMVLSRRVDNPETLLAMMLKYPLFKRVITISRGIREVLIKSGVRSDKISVVPSAVDTERYRPARDLTWFRREFELPESAVSIGVIAQLIERKGHQVLFEAAPPILKRHPNVKFLVFGKGRLAEPLARQCAHLGIEEAVRFYGFREDMERIIPCLDLIVHPALLEGLGVALLEAAACGVPIVATRVGGIPEIVQEGINGILVSPNNSGEIIQAVERLLENTAMRRLYGQAGRRIAVNAFSIETMVTGNYAVYQNLLGQDQSVLSTQAD